MFYIYLSETVFLPESFLFNPHNKIIFLQPNANRFPCLMGSYAVTRRLRQVIQCTSSLSQFNIYLEWRAAGRRWFSIPFDHNSFIQIFIFLLSSSLHLLFIQSFLNLRFLQSINLFIASSLPIFASQKSLLKTVLHQLFEKTDFSDLNCILP